MTDSSQMGAPNMYNNVVNSSNGSIKQAEDVYGGATSLADMKRSMNAMNAGK